MVSMVKIKFLIVDINDNAPTFYQPHINLLISESAAIGTTLAVVPRATDLDSPQNGVKKYQLKEQHQSLFGISVREEVLLQLKGLLDRELTASYHLTLVAFDGGHPSKSGVSKVSITVTDVNDNPPHFLNLPSVLYVSENQGWSELFKVQTDDADENNNAQVSVKLSNSTLQPFDSFFTLHPSTGVLSLLAPLDYESVPRVTLELMASDEGVPPLSSSATLIVEVADVNDNAPHIEHRSKEFSSSFSFSPPYFSVAPSSSSSSSSTFPFPRDTNHKYAEEQLIENCAPNTVVASFQVTDADSGLGGVVDCQVRVFDDSVRGFYR